MCKLSGWDILWYLARLHFENLKIKIFLCGFTNYHSYTNMFAGANFLIFCVVLNYITGEKFAMLI